MGEEEAFDMLFKNFTEFYVCRLIEFSSRSGFMEDLEIETVADVHMYLNQLSTIDDGGDPFEDEYYFSLYRDTVEGLKNLDLDMDLAMFEKRVVSGRYYQASQMVENALMEKKFREDGSEYEVPEVGDDPFRPSGNL